jgi:hypothetical protein
MLKALADGETNPAALAALADERLRATPEQLCDALSGCTELNPVYRRLQKMTLATFRRKIAVFDPAILCSEGDGNYLAVSFGPRSTIPGAAPLTTCWLAVGPDDGRC